MEGRGCEEDRRARQTRSRLAGKQVLLVDDDIFQVTALRDLLFEYGIGATIATSGVAALSCIEIVLPDAVVLDVRMPGCRGLELLSRLRARVPGLPVVLATGFEADHTLVRAMLETGDTAYVGKPIDVRHLVELLLQRLAGRTTGTSPSGDIGDLAPVAGAPEQLLGDLHQRVVLDSDHLPHELPLIFQSSRGQFDRGVQNPDPFSFGYYSLPIIGR